MGTKSLPWRFKILLSFVAGLALWALMSSPAPAERVSPDPFEGDRLRMVKEQIERRGVEDGRVLAAMRKVPRHLFVPWYLRGEAYEDRPLPIGEGQTISQPYIVALMTELLKVKKGDRVLEVGTGSGYQAAVLAEMGAEVVSVEIVRSLAESARERLRRLGYTTVTVIHGDGYYGYLPKAPYDGIVVTCAAPHVPPPLVEQLKPGGRMVIPVGQPFMTQTLMLVEKREDGAVQTRGILPVVFVPLVGH
ncbi:MAG: protein-L-isoaspartate(D-aspartate) O-methyltransferase [Deltaproteobacteria bacterium]|nr:MAG: protein-L-isoaspartate(D-aspartate) O-methyltransferase [Deltaproteobacteria bacterium]